MERTKKIGIICSVCNRVVCTPKKVDWEQRKRHVRCNKEYEIEVEMWRQVDEQRRLMGLPKRQYTNLSGKG